MTKQLSPTQRVVAGLTATTILVAQVTFPPHAAAASLGSSTVSAGSVAPPTASAIQSFQPDLFTGRATTSIPIAVPPGRKGIQPSLALTYSSSNHNGWLGVGWNLDLGYIERSTKNGVPVYDASDTYTFMLQGVTSDLVKIPDGTYRAKDEGLFLRFQNNGVSGWEVRDKSGTRYLFGETVAAQVESGGRVFRWCLDKVIDTNGNTMTLNYTKDLGQLYLAQILYTGHDPSGLVPANQVNFTLEDRPDIDTTLRSGFPILTAKRLKTITASTTVGGVLSLAHRYDLTYSQSSRTGRSLLSAVTPVGSDGTSSLLPTTLSYTQNVPMYMHCHNCVPSLSSGNHGWQLQYAIGHTFPHNDGGNDQRLWPGGSWDPGVKIWSEKVCHRTLFWRHCHDEGRSAAIPSISWGASHLETVGSGDGLSWSMDTNGNLTVNGPQDSHVLATTWLYTTTATTASLSSLSTSGHADVFYVSPGGSSWSVASGNQVPLSPGWTVVAVTAYDEMGGLSLGINANLATQAAAMNHSQFSPMGIVGDFNGDGYPDLAHLEPSKNHWHVILNSPNGFGPEQTWLDLILPSSTVVLVGDANGDGKADLILWDSTSGQWQVAISTGTSFSPPIIWNSGFGAGQTPFVGDFNGDQRLDVGTFSGGTWQVALSTGSGFSSPTTWLSGFGAGAAPLTGDFNGDGITDVAVAASGTISVALSNGSQLIPQPSAWTTSFGAGQNITTADVNGDGITDVVYYDKSTGSPVYAPSTGQQFGAAQPLMTDHPFGLRATDDTMQVGDFAANTLSGFGVFNPTSGAAEIASAVGTPPDLLNGLSNGLGATTTLTYTPSSQFANGHLPFVLPTVTQVIVSDGLGNSYVTSYTYANGLYDAPTKEFRGFARAEVRDVDANVSVTEFLQDEQRKGRPLRTRFLDAAGHLWTKAEQTWSSNDLYPGVHFVTLDQTDSFIYDGNASYRQARTRFTYDRFGNITRTDEDGWVADQRSDGETPQPTTGDERSAITTYATNESAWILNRPSLTQTLDATGAVIAQRRFMYDNATVSTTPPSVGNLTKEEEWLNLPTEQWLATTLTYDAYGNVATVKDALGRLTTNAYDAATNTYLAQITNTLGHTRKLTYDPRFGQIVSSTDQNNITTTTAYDALGRVASVIGPNDSSTLPTISYEYALSSPISTTITHTRIQSGQSDVVSVYTFTNGLGQTLQTRSPAEDPTKQIVTGEVERNARGLVIKQWAPYLDGASTAYVSHTLVSGLAPPTQEAYDPPGRVIQTTAPDGTVTLVDYNDGETTVSVADKTQTHRLANAYGQLIQVTEIPSPTEMWMTTYDYDAANRLIKVTDHAGHVTRISYDSLGRKLGMDDPDMGHWTYAYDAVDNLTSQTDARGVTISFSYDALNRVTQKSYTVPPTSDVRPQTSVTYVYDDPAKANSKGKLTSITDGSGSSSFEYDNLGRLIKESKTLDGTTYTIQRAYDLLGRLTALTYPDNEVARYTYDAQGGIETVDLIPATGPPGHLVTDVDYNAAGQLTKISYGNGVTTDYSYDPLTLRVSSLRTTNSALRTLQDFSYQFDPLGNVTAITDAVHTSTQTFQYDALSRLTQAVGTYGTLAYAYDPIGNMLNKEGVAMRYGEHGAGPHAVTSTISSQPSAASLDITYDANGNMLAKTPVVDGGSLMAQQLQYDAENRMVVAQTAQDNTTSITFHPGWNFFSLPVIPDDARITTLFPNFSRDFEQIARLTPAPRPLPPAPAFEHYVGNAKFDDFTTLSYGVGYEIYCKSASDVTVSFKGKLPTKQLSTSLASGWQLLPAIRLQTSDISTILSGLDYDQVLTYDSTTQSLKSTTTLDPGHAYYVHLRSAGTFAPSLPRDPTTKFLYDGDGGRVKQITPTGTTLFLGQSYEIAPDGTTTKYVFAGSERLAAIAIPPGQLARAPTAMSSTLWARAWRALTSLIASLLPTAEAALAPSALQFYHPDHLGSTNLVTDGTGAMVELSEATPYGASSRHEGTANVPYHFTGQRQDSATGLYFYHARYYDPQLGRFLQSDPFVQDPDDPQSLNRYAYVRNNPVNFVDPSGYGWFRKLLAVIGAVVATALMPEGAGFWWALASATVTAAGAMAGNQLGGLLESSQQGRLAYAATLESNSPRGPPVSSRIGQLLHAKSGQPISYEEAAYLGKYAGGGRLSIFLNGIDTTAAQATKQANDNARTLVVMYNPTKSPAWDLGESSSELWSGVTDLDRQLQALLDKLTAVGVPVDITAYSEGAIVATKSLEAGAPLVLGSTLHFVASPISRGRINAARPKGVKLDYTPTKWTDPINIVQSANPFKMFGGVVGGLRDLVTGGRYSTHRIGTYLPSQTNQ